MSLFDIQSSKRMKQSLRELYLVDLPKFKENMSPNFFRYFDFIKISHGGNENDFQNFNNNNNYFYYYYGYYFPEEENYAIYRILVGSNHANIEMIRGNDGRQIFLHLPGLLCNLTADPSGQYFYALYRIQNVTKQTEEDTIGNLSLYKINVRTMEVTNLKIQGQLCTIAYEMELDTSQFLLHFMSNGRCFISITFTDNRHFYRNAGIEQLHRQTFRKKIYSLALKNGKCHTELIELPEPPTGFLENFEQFGIDHRVLNCTKEINIKIISKNEASISTPEDIGIRFYHLDYCYQLFVLDENRLNWNEFSLDMDQNEMRIESVGRSPFRHFYNYGCIISHDCNYYKLYINFSTRRFYFKKLFYSPAPVHCSSDATMFFIRHWKCFELFYWNLPPTLVSLSAWKLMDYKSGGKKFEENELYKLLQKYETDRYSLMLGKNSRNIGYIRLKMNGNQAEEFINFLLNEQN